MTTTSGGLAVVYDKGAVSAAEIGRGLAGLGRVTFLVAASDHTARLGQVLARLGDVVRLTGDPDADAAAVRALEPDAITTYSEPMLRTTARLAEATGLPFHEAATALLLTDKARQRATLREAGADDVRSRPLTGPGDWPEAIAEVGYPAIVKPVRGEGSRDTYTVADEDEARAVLSRLMDGRAASEGPGFVVEELLTGRPGQPFGLGDYVSVESAVGPDGVTHLAVTGKFRLVPPFREVGQFWPAALPDDEHEEVLRLTTRALRALGVTTGLTHTEIKLTARGPRVIEVNGRLGGHVNELARRAAGIDLVRVGGLLALGKPVGLDPLCADRVYFQYHNLAPTVPCELAGVQGAEEVRRRTGVDGYRAFSRPGDRLPGGVMTQEMDILTGACDGHDTLLEVVDGALDALTYAFRFPGGTLRVPAADLRTEVRPLR
ncbi:ATP-grasp domain-containing protein [Streptomyces pini]|uniref:Biotin carboxylase n=1 Tax=Streptomyces pini TaxID=1520580 RepID=A0A1I4GT95_9ACTN|nr:ATP-grasp domain-containing protein [Streptomyces pini]SFL32693.1 Biotin carboxylase [Streptomyces pini]